MLLHISSLPSLGGIGTLGKCAYVFVDFLKACDISIWQVLPIGPTNIENSPYQSLSTYAGNPYFIDLEMLKDEELLKLSETEALGCSSDAKLVDYNYLVHTRNKILRIAFGRINKNVECKINKFAEENLWLTDYALYSAVRDHFEGMSWTEWPDNSIRFRQPQAIKKYSLLLYEDINFYKFVQYYFFKQWHALKQYANDNGISIFGDIPIYVAMDSSDTWANPDVFLLDDHKHPTYVAGVPPDYFSKDGQLWGNPLYNWKKLKRSNYEWWISRMRAMSELYDMMRIDHFIGFANYYAIPAGAATARAGVWRKGPSRKFFRIIDRKLPAISIVAEDLGFQTPKGKRLLEYCGYPGMKVLTFAFNSDEENMHLPHNIHCNSVLYTGTHDNDTINGWWQKAEENEHRFTTEYLKLDNNSNIWRSMIEAAFQSKADTVIIPMQDYLGLDSVARMNTPGTIGNNWKWRLLPEQLSDEVKDYILHINKKYKKQGGECNGL